MSGIDPTKLRLLRNAPERTGGAFPATGAEHRAALRTDTAALREGLEAVDKAPSGASKRHALANLRESLTES